MGKLMDHTSRIVQVEHIRVWTGTPFAEVVRRIEAETGVFGPQSGESPRGDGLIVIILFGAERTENGPAGSCAG